MNLDGSKNSGTNYSSALSGRTSLSFKSLKEIEKSSCDL